MAGVTHRVDKVAAVNGNGELPGTRRQPAPGGLELVRAFINTVDIEAGTDDLATAAGVDAWLRARDLAVDEGGTTEREWRRLVAFREALRDLLLPHELGTSDDAPRRVLDDAARTSPLAVTFDVSGQPILQSTQTGVAGLMAQILLEISVASIAGTWSRLKVCRNDACRWAFYDASRNHSGIWCTMAVCGNRAKVRALRDRRRAACAPG